MNTKIISTVLFASLIFSVNTAFAAPLPPTIAINEQTKECSRFFMGDECLDCFLPDGWTKIEGYSEDSCPKGYNIVNDKSVNCQGFKVAHCCTIDHTGANGDCEDVVISDEEKSCGFVEDINNCPGLPDSWYRAKEVDRFGRVCPFYNYKWREESIQCTADTNNPDLNTPTKTYRSIIFWLEIIGLFAALGCIFWGIFAANKSSSAEVIKTVKKVVKKRKK
jgi:hypothetical protein